MKSRLGYCMLKLRSFGHMAQDLLERQRPGFRAFLRQRNEFYRMVWQDCATRLGARIEGLNDEIFEITRGGLRTRVCKNYTAIDDPVTLSVAGDKPLVHQLLTAQDIPVPSHATFSLRDLSRAYEFLDATSQRDGKACVVKPAKGSGAGHGVTTGVTTRSRLRRAAACAARFTDNLLIEEQCAGDNFRLTYLDGRLLDAVRRGSPTVVGDGRSSIRTLIELANRARLAGGWKTAQVAVRPSADMRHTLARQGLSLRSVPQEGQRVPLKTAINDNAAFENTSVTGQVCRSVAETGAKAASVVGARFAGVDIVTPDPGRPLQEAGGVVLEVNTTPGLYYHWHGDSSPVAIALLELLLHESQLRPTGSREQVRATRSLSTQGVR